MSIKITLAATPLSRVRGAALIIASLLCSGTALGQLDDFLYDDPYEEPLYDDPSFTLPDPFSGNKSGEGMRQEFGSQGSVPLEDDAFGQGTGEFDENIPGAFEPSYRSPQRGIPNYRATDDEQRNVLPAVGGAEQAKGLIMRYGCASGGTLGQCMQRRAVMPGFKDGGWTVRASDEGGYIVDRVLLLNGTLPMHYTWQVDSSGQVLPLTPRAEMITVERF